MSVFSRAACLFDRHDPDRRRVTWDGWNYIGPCRHCGADIERLGAGKWRRQKRQDSRPSENEVG